MNTLKAEKRDMSIKAKKLRREGYVTGNLFGREINGSIPVKIEKSAAEKLLKTSNKGSQILLELEGTSYDVLIKEVQYNSMKGQIEEIDFQALVKGEKVHAVTEIFLLTMKKSTPALCSSCCTRSPTKRIRPICWTKLKLMWET